MEYLGDTVEALIEAGRSGAKVLEHPIAMTPRAYGRGHAGPVASLWYVLRVMIAIELQYKRRNVPLETMPADPLSQSRVREAAPAKTPR